MVVHTLSTVIIHSVDIYPAPASIRVVDHDHEVDKVCACQCRFRVSLKGDCKISGKCKDRISITHQGKPLVPLVGTTEDFLEDRKHKPIPGISSESSRQGEGSQRCLLSLG